MSFTYVPLCTLLCHKAFKSLNVHACDGIQFSGRGDGSLLFLPRPVLPSFHALILAAFFKVFGAVRSVIGPGAGRLICTAQCPPQL